MDLKFVFLICLIPAASAKFQVEAKDKELVVAVGSDVELPCTLSPPSSAVGLEVRWFHTVFHSVVYLLKDGREDREQQKSEYRDRAFLKSGPQTGNLALSLLKVRISDAGTYHCFVENRTIGTIEEALIELRVIGLGSPPLVKVSLQGSLVQLSCFSSNWYPAPEMTWRRADGAIVSAEAKTEKNPNDGLISLTNDIILKEFTVENFFCEVIHSATGKEARSHVMVLESMFPRVSKWVAAFIVLLICFLTIAALAAWRFYIYRNKKAPQKQEIEWRKVSVYKESVLFDPFMASSHLTFSPDYCLTQAMENPPSIKDGYVLAQPCFDSGRHYWETEVHKGSDGVGCLIGVAVLPRESKDIQILSAIGFGQTESYFNIQCERAMLVGIFIDIEEATVSYYNVNTFQRLHYDKLINTKDVSPFYCVAKGVTFKLNPDPCRKYTDAP
uniref:Butyrophilin subfamily 1 member A1 n=2 Tax=Xenopus tropicalis TaxID=8364 RepID=A0A803K3D8_XENTR